MTHELSERFACVHSHVYRWVFLFTGIKYICFWTQPTFHIILSTALGCHWLLQKCTAFSLPFSCSWHKQEHVTFLCFLIPPVGLVEAAMVAAPEAGVSTLSMAQSYSLYVLLIVRCSCVMVNLSNPDPATYQQCLELACHWLTIRNFSLTNILPKLFFLT